MARRGDGISPWGQGRGEGWAMAGTAPGGFTYPPEPPCGLGRALERADLLRRLAKVLRARLHA